MLTAYDILKENSVYDEDSSNKINKICELK